MSALWALFGLVLLAFLGPPLSASATPPSAAAGGEGRTLSAEDAWGGRVDLESLPQQDLYAVHGTFEAPVRPEAAWSVLGDYDHLAGIVEGLEASRVLERGPGSLLLEQVLRGRFLFFHRTLTLRLRVLEREPERMDFVQYGPGPFRRYQGSWTVRPEGRTGCRVDYFLSVSRGDLAPRWLEPGLFRDNASELLRSMSREMRRRAAMAAAPHLEPRSPSEN